MRMKAHLASLVVLFATSAPLLSATEVERLRALCAEQELQIAQLELKISRLSDTPVPSTTRKTAIADKPVVKDSAPKSEVSTYTIIPGDHLAKIARKLNVSVSSLENANGITRNTTIFPGQKLKVPGIRSEQNRDEKDHIAETKTPSKQLKHTITSGETFYKISRKYGVSVNQLVAANPNVNHNALRIGQVINIGGSNEVASKPIEKKPVASLQSTPSVPVSNTPARKPQLRAFDQPVKITKEITYGKFAENHNTTTERLDELNGLQLKSSTVLAQGSELYIPAQP